MNPQQILQERGALVLAALIAALLAFLVLHIVKAPLIVLVKILTVCQYRLNTITADLATGTGRLPRPGPGAGPRIPQRGVTRVYAT